MDPSSGAASRGPLYYSHTVNSSLENLNTRTPAQPKAFFSKKFMLQLGINFIVYFSLLKRSRLWIYVIDFRGIIIRCENFWLSGGLS